jgi:hypothetical protein
MGLMYAPRAARGEHGLEGSMADKDGAQLGWGDEKAAPVVIQSPSGGGRGAIMILGLAMVFALALTGFFGWQWSSVTSKYSAAEKEFGIKEAALKTQLAEAQAVNRAEAAYALALQQENQAIREGKSPPPTTISPLQDWIDDMRIENSKLRNCLNNPRASGCGRPIPVTPTPALAGGSAIPRDE